MDEELCDCECGEAVLECGCAHLPNTLWLKIERLDWSGSDCGAGQFEDQVIELTYDGIGGIGEPCEGNPRWSGTIDSGDTVWFCCSPISDVEDSFNKRTTQQGQFLWCDASNEVTLTGICEWEGPDAGKVAYRTSPASEPQGDGASRCACTPGVFDVTVANYELS
jgi:hypothetical protein